MCLSKCFLKDRIRTFKIRIFLPQSFPLTQNMKVYNNKASVIGESLTSCCNESLKLDPKLDIIGHSSGMTQAQNIHLCAFNNNY